MLSIHGLHDGLVHDTLFMFNDITGKKVHFLGLTVFHSIRKQEKIVKLVVATTI
jgi:hypothetical protein